MILRYIISDIYLSIYPGFNVPGFVVPGFEKEPQYTTPFGRITPAATLLLCFALSIILCLNFNYDYIFVRGNYATLQVCAAEQELVHCQSVLSRKERRTCRHRQQRRANLT